MDKILKVFYISIFFIAWQNTSWAQAPSNKAFTDTLYINRDQAEARLLQSSLVILSEKLNIDIAEAEKWQAKLWPNPNLSIEEVNLWSNYDKLGEGPLPPFWGNFGEAQQVAIGLEQLVITAGKRKKLIALEQVGVDQAEQYFNDFLRGLKESFREMLTELQYLEKSKVYHEKQLQSITELSNAMERQVKMGNMGKGDFIRLKSAQMQIKKNLFDIQEEIIETNASLALLLNIPPNIYISLGDQGFKPSIDNIKSLNLGEIENIALEERPDLLLAKLDQKYYAQLESYEKAQRVPDLNLKFGYDRGGNVQQDFVGFGVSIDLPFFDRNQGNIKQAQLSKQQAAYQEELKTNEVSSEIRTAYFNLLNELSFYQEIDQDYEGELDLLLENYTKNFREKNISLMVYLDFLEAYMENKETLLESVKSVHQKTEALQYSVGRDILKAEN